MSPVCKRQRGRRVSHVPVPTENELGESALDVSRKLKHLDCEALVRSHTSALWCVTSLVYVKVLHFVCVYFCRCLYTCAHSCNKPCPTNLTITCMWSMSGGSGGTTSTTATTTLRRR